MIDPNIEMIFIDLFAGAGGVTTGVEKSRINGKKACKVIAAVNHDELAIKSHAANHPDVVHFIEDIRMLNVYRLLEVVQQARVKYPNAMLAMWASLECTNFSKAKGGQPREADSRTLAYSLYKSFDQKRNVYIDGLSYIQILNPDIIYIENVEEFMSWGPLDDAGRPESMREGQDYIKWVEKMQGFGYNYSHRLINSADHGAFTSRKRFFAQFIRHGIPIGWPEATHAKKQRSDVFGSFIKWKAVREVLDLTDEGNSIFTRKTPLSERTHERIYHGLIKHVGDGTDSFLSKYYSGKPDGKNITIEGPAGSITTKDSHAFVKCCFLQKYNSMAANGSMKHATKSIGEPSPTITTQNRISVVQAFMVQYHGKGKSVSIDGPATTITTRDRLAFIKTSQFIDRQYGNSKPASIDEPIGSILAEPKSNLVSSNSYLIDQSYGNASRTLEAPAPTVLACRKNHYLVNPQFNSAGSCVDNPCFTLIARMDKRPPYLVSVLTGKSVIMVYPSDSEIMVKIKLFMAAYGIYDIKIRMLKIPELKLIMGFPKEYILLGTQGDQKKFIGNAVETTTAQRIIEASVLAIIERKKQMVA
jgi:DNA (cytosine-5)-methyltransferase 1